MLNPLNIISKFIKSGNQKELDRIQKIVNKINFLENEVTKFEDSNFPLKTNEFISRLKDGEKLCNQLNIKFDEVYSRTNTSYKPYPSGNSDYKSASSVERIEAFIKLDRPDPVQYEDETGPVAYEVAKTHVEKLLAEYAS